MPSFSSSKTIDSQPGPAPPPYFETVTALPHQVSVTLPPYNPDDFPYVLPPRLVFDQPACRPTLSMEPVRTTKKRTIVLRLLCSLSCVLALLIVPFLIYVILVDLHVSAGQTRIIDHPRI
ncbi:hypothetical protein QR680_016073 [Steinernema hermaphroditum]|uniref:Uncharacterized protein n=1 Tax=Steinernema hermaphroditum TaxID=289476 RepID=A0AA39H9Z0_9BILA|nr:hypothetical protein QR680_016073 [Steinernema hermaphroditum]